MHEYGDDILYILKLKQWLGSNSVSRPFLLQLSHGHCLVTVAIILDI